MHFWINIIKDLSFKYKKRKLKKFPKDRTKFKKFSKLSKYMDVREFCYVGVIFKKKKGRKLYGKLNHIKWSFFPQNFKVLQRTQNFICSSISLWTYVNMVLILSKLKNVNFAFLLPSVSL